MTDRPVYSCSSGKKASAEAYLQGIVERWLKMVSNKYTRIRPIDLNPNAVLWFAFFVTLEMFCGDK